MTDASASSADETNEGAYALLHERVTGSAPVAGAASISVAQYDAARAEYFRETGDQRATGVNVWPPTSQTIRAHLGGGSWSAAMQSMNLAARPGRPAGAGKFSESDYVATVQQFLEAVERGDAPSSSFGSLTSWIRLQKADGRSCPSPAAVRQHFGTWEAAKVAARTESLS